MHVCMYVCMYDDILRFYHIKRSLRKLLQGILTNVRKHACTRAHTHIYNLIWDVTVRHRGSVNNIAYDCGFRSKIKSSTDSYVRMCVCVCVQYIPDLYLVTL